MSSIELDAHEARVLGVLLEKEVTTPDVYPLSLNAATSGCNQKSARDPVMTLSEAQVRHAMESLVTKTLAREQGSAGGRTRRFSHRMDSRLFGTLEFSRAERAVLCVLLLRGPQTPGEIRTRTSRLVNFQGLDEVEALLSGLAARDDGPHVAALPREPGRREVRYRHLFGPEAQARESTSPPAHAQAAALDVPQTVDGDAAGHTLQSLARRLAAAEARIDALEAALEAAPTPAFEDEDHGGAN